MRSGVWAAPTKAGVRLVAAAAVVFAVAGQVTSASTVPNDADGIRVALVLPGEINDLSWNQQMYDGAVALEEEGLVSELAYTELVPEGDAERAIRGYADDGFDLVVATPSDTARPPRQSPPITPIPPSPGLVASPARTPTSPTTSSRSTRPTTCSASSPATSARAASSAVLAASTSPPATRSSRPSTSVPKRSTRRRPASPTTSATGSTSPVARRPRRPPPTRVPTSSRRAVKDRCSARSSSPRSAACWPPGTSATCRRWLPTR